MNFELEGELSRQRQSRVSHESFWHFCSKVLAPQQLCMNNIRRISGAVCRQASEKWDGSGTEVGRRELHAAGPSMLMVEVGERPASFLGNGREL